MTLSSHCLCVAELLFLLNYVDPWETVPCPVPGGLFSGSFIAEQGGSICKAWEGNGWRPQGCAQEIRLPVSEGQEVGPVVSWLRQHHTAALPTLHPQELLWVTRWERILFLNLKFYPRDTESQGNTLVSLLPLTSCPQRELLWAPFLILTPASLALPPLSPVFPSLIFLPPISLTFNFPPKVCSVLFTHCFLLDHWGWPLSHLIFSRKFDKQCIALRRSPVTPWTTNILTPLASPQVLGWFCLPLIAPSSISTLVLSAGDDVGPFLYSLQSCLCGHNQRPQGPREAGKGPVRTVGDTVYPAINPASIEHLWCYQDCWFQWRWCLDHNNCPLKS